MSSTKKAKKVDPLSLEDRCLIASKVCGIKKKQMKRLVICLTGMGVTLTPNNASYKATATKKEILRDCEFALKAYERGLEG
jgi:hypothetical protein